jgi:hypothetical protein
MEYLNDQETAANGNADCPRTGNNGQSNIAKLSLADVLILTASHPHIAKTALTYIPRKIIERSLPPVNDVTGSSTAKCRKTNG